MNEENKLGRLEKFIDWVNADEGLKQDNHIEEVEEHHEEEVVKETKQSKEATFFGEFRVFYSIFSVVVTCLIIGVLLFTVTNLPGHSGVENNPMINEVYNRYVFEGLKDTGATNLVTGIILDYRAFDTLGESFMLFVATSAIIMIIKETNTDGSQDKKESAVDTASWHPMILKTVVNIMFPFVIIFGIYVVMNGHLSPGGGFSGGAIIGAGLTLYAAANGIDKVREFFTFKTFKVAVGASLLFYALAKGLYFFSEINNLGIQFPLGTPGNILSAGLILPLNICVGIIVSCTIYALFALFSEGEV